MTIGIDARLWGLKHAGIGRYVLNLVINLLEQDSENHYLLFGPSEISKDIPKKLHIKFTHIITNITHYSLLEQIQFPLLLQQYPIDLMHFPHFNVPLIYNKPFVVTIHDILWHQVRGDDVTTLSGWKYSLKYIGYKQVVAHAIAASQKIIVPSNWVKKQLLQEFNQLNLDNVHVIYEGSDHVTNVERRATSDDQVAINDKLLEENFYLYVGSCYPHKNVATLIQAMRELKDSGNTHKLVIVCSRNVFVSKLETQVNELGLEGQVIFVGRLSDQDLHDLYRSAIALVHPSLSEGFGLTGLEAMKHGCLVVSSQEGSLSEIYDDFAVFLEDPLNPVLMADTMTSVNQTSQQIAQLKKDAITHASGFTWKKTAAKTIEVYNSVL